GGGPEVLNAWRRHCGRHIISAYQGSSKPTCSTPGGVTVVGTLAAVSLVVGPRRVLNAWRRHCGRHPTEAPQGVSRDECSTPGGVTVVGTATTGWTGRRWSGAQRLAASLWSARSLGVVTGVANGCSTPGGVTVVGTPTHGRLIDRR